MKVGGRATGVAPAPAIDPGSIRTRPNSALLGNGRPTELKLRYIILICIRIRLKAGYKVQRVSVTTSRVPVRHRVRGRGQDVLKVVQGLDSTSFVIRIQSLRS